MRRAPLLLAALICVLPAGTAAQDTEALYRAACDGGDFIACNVFGLMYEHGEGIPRDLTLAAAFYERACEGGELIGCTNLGLMYESGLGVVQDAPRATGLYRVACEGGELLGCAGLREREQVADTASNRRYFKAGRVGDADGGAALSEAVVRVPSLDIVVTTDAEGRFQLTDLPAGTYTLRAERFGYEAVEGELVVPGDPEFLVLMERADIGDPEVPGRIVGRVSAEPGDRPLADVEITVLGQGDARTLSNRQGRFTLRDVEPGLVVMRFVRLGYAPRTATLVVQPDRTIEVAPTMSAEPIELEPVQVTVYSSYLEQSGFYRRAASGWGTQFSSLDIERINPVLASDVVRRAPGIHVEYPRGPGAPVVAVSRRSFSPRGGACVMSVWVDGVRMVDPDLDQIPLEWLEAVEVYQGLDVPPEYGFGLNSCGAVLMWTRRR